jgi:hypothetical protein
MTEGDLLAADSPPGANRGRGSIRRRRHHAYNRYTSIGLTLPPGLPDESILGGT